MSKRVVVISLVACFLVYVIEQLLPVSIIVIVLSKIVLFLGAYGLFSLFYKARISPLRKINKHILIKSIGWGVAFALVILIVYRVLQPFIDVSSMVADLDAKHITPMTFVFVAVYITFVNSFLEEFFFRGFILLNISKPRFAAIFSSTLFALYHLAAFQQWFSWWQILICFVGLFVSGIFFCYLNVKSKSMVPSWITHMIADVAIVWIGFAIFGLL